MSTNLGYCPKYVLNYGIFIQDVIKHDAGTINSLLYFPDVNIVMYYTERLSSSHSLSDRYIDLLKNSLAVQLYITQNSDLVFEPEILYEIITSDADIEFSLLELKPTDFNYKYKIEMYKIYIDWYNNYYLSDTTDIWKQIRVFTD
jgi:hypothetical protein